MALLSRPHPMTALLTIIALLLLSSIFVPRVWAREGAHLQKADKAGGVDADDHLTFPDHHWCHVVHTTEVIDGPETIFISARDECIDLRTVPEKKMYAYGCRGLARYTREHPPNCSGGRCNAYLIEGPVTREECAQSLSRWGGDLRGETIYEVKGKRHPVVDRWTEDCENLCSENFSPTGLLKDRSDCRPHCIGYWIGMNGIEATPRYLLENQRRGISR